MSDWTTDSNDALELQLVRSPEDADVLEDDELRALEPFHPSFTYPIFGDQEKIYGYQGLSISLKFASGSLRQYLDITHDEKIDSKDTPAEDIEGKLYQFVPSDYTKSDSSFGEWVEKDAEVFKPLGEKMSSYVRPSAAALAQAGGGAKKGKAKGKGKGKANGSAVALTIEEGSDDAVVYEVYKATWSTPGFRDYHRRMQLFILLFIEGGSYVHEDEDAWEFYVLYERRKRRDSELYTYHFIGYTSVYPFWCYPELVRLRLSQFVILPPYQEQGHGSALYSALYQHLLTRPEVAELTVEDPAEAFEDLRDRNDLRFLVKQGILDDPKLQDGVGTGIRGPRVKWEQGIRKKYKIAQRQFDRLLEMLLLRELDRKDVGKVKAYRLQVKARLYRFNYEMLMQLTVDERKEALKKTYESVVEDYDRILAMTFP